MNEINIKGIFSLGTAVRGICGDNPTWEDVERVKKQLISAGYERFAYGHGMEKRGWAYKKKGTHWA